MKSARIERVLVVLTIVFINLCLLIPVWQSAVNSQLRFKLAQTEEELKERGLNFSMTHVDFMVGSADMSIIGTTHEGEEVEIFRNGNFTF